MRATGEARGDEELMLAYRDGDNTAFDALYQRHRGALYRYVVRQCGDRAAAEELFQDVWMNLIRARGSYVVTAKFTTYLYKLAHNRLIDHYRRQSPAALVSFDDDDAAIEHPPAPTRDEPAAAFESKAQAARFLALLDSLPPAQREAFVLQQEGGMSIEEIAQATGVGHETAKSRLRYAIARLREGMRAWQ